MEREKRDITISPRLVDEYAKSIDPALYYAAFSGKAVADFIVLNNGKDVYHVARDISEKAHADLVLYKSGEETSQISFGFENDDKLEPKRKAIVQSVFEEFGVPRSSAFKNPDYNEVELQKLKRDIENQILCEIRLKMPSPESIKNSIRRF